MRYLGSLHRVTINIMNNFIYISGRFNFEERRGARFSTRLLPIIHLQDHKNSHTFPLETLKGQV